MNDKRHFAKHASRELEPLRIDTITACKCYLLQAASRRREKSLSIALVKTEDLKDSLKSKEE